MHSRPSRLAARRRPANWLAVAQAGGRLARFRRCARGGYPEDGRTENDGQNVFLSSRTEECWESPRKAGPVWNTLTVRALAAGRVRWADARRMPGGGSHGAMWGWRCSPSPSSMDAHWRRQGGGARVGGERGSEGADGDLWERPVSESVALAPTRAGADWQPPEAYSSLAALGPAEHGQQLPWSLVLGFRRQRPGRGCD